MPAIDIRRNIGPNRRRAVLTSPEWRFSPPGSRWGGFNLSFSQIREISKKSPTVQSIITLRQNQVASYMRTPRHRGDSGFEIVRADDPGKITNHDAHIIKFVEDFLMSTGAYTHEIRRPSLPVFAKMFVRDIYLVGAASVELVFDQAGRLAEFIAVDAATIEIQWAERYIPTTREGKMMDQPVRYVQVVDGQVMAEFADDELVYAVLSPVTDIANGGYPISAAEACIDWIAAEVLALQYNSNFFDHGSVPPGILSLIGNYTDDTITTLKTMWETDVKGVVGQHKPVVLAVREGQSVQWISMKPTNRDMEYAAFTEQLSNKICSVFGADPVEVGQRTASTTHGMSASDNTEVKLEAGRSKGLLPLLDAFEQMINERIMQHLAPGYIFRFTGVGGEEDEQAKVNFLNAQLNQGALTAREWRRAMGLSDAPEGSSETKSFWIDMPANQQLLQYVAMDFTARGLIKQPGQPGQPGQQNDAGGEEQPVSQQTMDPRALAQVLQQNQLAHGQNDQQPVKKSSSMRSRKRKVENNADDGIVRF